MGRNARRLGALARAAATAATVLWVGCTNGGPRQAAAPVTADEVTAPGQVCTPSGKHGEHAAAGVACTTCHLCAGTVAFDPAIAALTGWATHVLQWR